MPSSNISDTEAYSRFDHFFVAGVPFLSRVVGMPRLTRPFWDRWRTGDIGDDVLFDFLNAIRSLDDWPDSAESMVSKAEKDLAAERSALSRDVEVQALRRLSYMANLGHWGILPINTQKIACYTKSRDIYIEAETLAFGYRDQRVNIPREGHLFHGNLHLPCSAPPRW